MTSPFFTDSPHTIRLRGPWQYCVLEGTPTAPAGTSGQIQMPADWSATLGAEFRGVVRYTRKFGCPSGLTDLVHVLLVVSAVNNSATIQLNDQPLGRVTGSHGPQAFDISERLQPRNQLDIDVSLPIDLDLRAEHNRADGDERSGGLIGEVRLEIGQELTSTLPATSKREENI